MADYRVRNANTSDLDEICRIENESFPEPFPRHLLEHLLRDERITFLAATDKAGLIVGYCAAALENHRGHLISIAVKHSGRRTGIALSLLDKLIRVMEDSDAEHLWLEVRPDNTAAITLYEKLGFLRAGSAPSYYRDGMDALLMYLPFQRRGAAAK